MKAFWFVLIFALNTAAENLEFLELKTFGPELEISGFVPLKGSLYALSDNKDDVYLYNLRPNEQDAPIEVKISLRKLKGFWPYYISALMWKQNGRWAKSPWDLEGGAVCADAIYLVNEQVRHALKVKDNKLEVIDLDLKAAFKKLGTPVEKTAVNAGFEGVAVDCENNIIYIAQERGPRAIFSFNLENGKFLTLTQTSEENSPHSDYSDLYFENKNLYVIERNKRRILKISPGTGEVIDSGDYKILRPDLQTKELYHTGKPYGFAEALYMDADYIYLGLDNNGNSFTEKGKKSLELKGPDNGSSLLKFKRPKGF